MGGNVDHIVSLDVSVDSVPFGKTGLRITLGNEVLFRLSPSWAREFAEKLMKVADEAEKVSL